MDRASEIAESSGASCASAAILTFHFVQNFGAVCQAYALKCFLESYGVQTTIIDYVPRHVERGAAFRWPRSRKDVRANIVNAYLRSQGLRRRLFGDRRQAAAFERFRQTLLGTASRRYSDFDELRASPPTADAVVCGSDQIWHASKQYGLDPAYFLAFAAPGQRRVAYAPSFGKAMLAEGDRAEAAKWIRKLDAISVREVSGARIVRELAGLECPVVPDPTLLLDDYSELLDSSRPEMPRPARSYLLSYGLRDPQSVYRMAQDVSSKSRLPAVNVQPMQLSPRTGRNDVFPGPIEWLALIRDAEYVVTNSFHGVAFSIIFRKPFVAVALAGRKAAMNDRAESLLQKLGLGDRLISSDEPDPHARLNRPIDWESVHGRICAWRTEARGFLESALGLGRMAPSCSQ